MFFKYWKNIIEMNKVDSRKSIELNTNHLVVNLLNLKNFINNKLNDFYFLSEENLDNHSLKEDINSFLAMLN